MISWGLRPQDRSHVLDEETTEVILIHPAWVICSTQSNCPGPLSMDVSEVQGQDDSYDDSKDDAA